VDALLAGGQLVTPFDAGIESARAYRLIIDPAARSRPAVKAFEQWLLAECGPDDAASAIRTGPARPRKPPRR
jgi:LysR family transcriptional regulator, glycine cleavage system transcriptional activator